MRTLKLIILCTTIVLLPLAAQGLETPVVYYSFDNITGDTVPDLSGAGNDGTLEDGPEIVAGQFGRAVTFASSRISIPASDSLSGDLFSEGLFTVVVWINAPRTGNQWHQIFRANRAAQQSNDTLFINNDGRLSWRGRVGGGWAGGMCETVAGAVDADTWTHAAVVSDANNFRIYVNGELAQESQFQQTDGENELYLLGGEVNRAGETYSGAVDDFAVFATPLEEAMIQTIIEQGVGAAAPVESTGKLATRWAARPWNPLASWQLGGQRSNTLSERMACQNRTPRRGIRRSPLIECRVLFIRLLMKRGAVPGRR